MAEETKPCLIIEVSSPQFPGDETEKVEIYQRVGVQEYIIIVPNFADKTRKMTMIGYRLIDGVYQPMAADIRGRFLSLTTNVFIELDQENETVRIFEWNETEYYNHIKTYQLWQEAIRQRDIALRQVDALQAEVDQLRLKYKNSQKSKSHA
ncbi:MAG: Uma2 family endonuclease [Chloroflexota bacterium]